MAPSSRDQILPTKAVFDPTDPLSVDINADGPWTLTLWHHADQHAQIHGTGPQTVTLPATAPGGYALTLDGATTHATSAIEIASPAAATFRYGFVASYSPDKDIAGVVDHTRRMHLSGIQFYDWAYRHADLLGGGDTYQDALDQTISLRTVRSLADALRQAGSHPLGYAAVYGIGDDEWDQWQHAALTRSDNSTWSLAGFLRIIDPADPAWLKHFTTDLQAATHLGFDGFHLDQYGAPRLATNTDGDVIDLAQSFVTVIEQARHALPDSLLCFNNVNNFGTEKTAHAPQDLTYIEVWEPNTTLEHLNRLAWDAHHEAPTRPVILAAYQSVYAHAATDAAEQANRYAMAAILGAGATQLLTGEDGHLLTDPYYVHNHTATPTTMTMLQSWYDFDTANTELLHVNTRWDATSEWFGPLNDEITIHGTDIPISTIAIPGSIWVRVVRLDTTDLVLHLVNLAQQTHVMWDHPKQTPAPISGLQLQLRGVNGAPEVLIGDPDISPVLHRANLVADTPGEWMYDLPDLNTWQMICIKLAH